MKKVNFDDNPWFKGKGLYEGETSQLNKLVDGIMITKDVSREEVEEMYPEINDEGDML